jgi:tRNA-binding EMAP/Myf-like protein
MNLHVVEITKISPHPEATKLKLCEVSDGVNKTTVVCGASNVRLGLRTIFAPVGSTTPLKLEIKTAILRGVESHGMLCSPKDLGIRAEDGIVDLPENFRLGQSFSELNPDELSSTPWYQYKLIERFVKKESGEVYIQRDFSKNVQGKLMSETYFESGEYLYRHF